MKRLLHPGARLSIPFAFVVAALPKCPVCLALVLSSVGLGSLISASWLLPLTLVFLGVALGPLGLRAVRRREAGPFLAGLAASVVIVFGRFYADSLASVVAGAVLLVCASVWGARTSNGRGEADPCCHPRPGHHGQKEASRDL